MNQYPEPGGKSFMLRVGVLAGVLLLACILLSGCPLKKHLKKENPEPVIKKDPIMVYSYKDINKNNKFEPWYNETLIEEKWFFRDDDDIIIYIPHEDAKKGDEINYCILSPNGTKIINRHTLTSNGGCLKIQGGCKTIEGNPDGRTICTKLGRYLSATGAYGTFEIIAYLNDTELGKKQIKIWPTAKQ